ncbi:hypothetical protein DN068_01055 [Taibaiella soli]|uniref:Uncharacterized protein n=1 Tax=Taibaiella soli TaxID=1649169 RepID=A0A2W2BMX8_9BACT|nr:hypothetical protein DN068_01055 [Taibaiella soli]
MFYIHFQNGRAIEQIEVNSQGAVFLSEDQLSKGESKLFEHSLSDLELDRNDFITKDEFYLVWNNQ